MMNKQGHSGRFKRLRQQAEELLENKSAQGTFDTYGIFDVIHELEVHQTELELQNKELQKTQQELSALHQEYEKLYELAPMGYITVNAQGLVTRANRTAIDLLSVKKQHLLGTPVRGFIAPGWEGAFRSSLQKSAQTGARQSVELPLSRKPQGPLWVRADIQAEQAENLEVISWQIALMDITDRKLQAEELRQVREEAEHQAEEYALAMESIAQGVVFYDTKHMITRMNPAAENILGFSSQEVHDLPPQERIDRLHVKDVHGQALPQEKLVGFRALQGQVVTSEELVLTPRGKKTPITVLSNAAPIRTEQGEIIGAIQTFMDITERKQALEALQRSEATFRRLAEANLMGVGVGDEEGRISYINDEMMRMMGHTREDFQAGRINWTRSLAPECIEEHSRSMQEMARFGRTVGYEKAFVHPDGTRTPFLGAAARIPGTDEHVSIALDLTQIKATEETLRRTRAEAEANADQARGKELLLLRVLEVLPVGVFISDQEGRLAWTNPEAERIWGRPSYGPIQWWKEYKGWWAETQEPIVPDEWPFARAFFKGEISLDQVIDIECFDGTHKTILNSAAPVFDQDGTIDSAVAVTADITQLKKTEKALRENEEKFKTIFQICPDPLVIVDRETETIQDANPAYLRMTGATSGLDVIGKTAEDSGLWLDENQRVALRKALNDKGSVQDFEITLRTRSGEVLFGIVSLELLSLDKKTCILAVVKDISAWKRAEEEANSRAAQLEATLYAMSDGVVIYDAEGGPILVNRAAWDIFALPEGYFDQPILERTKRFTFEQDGRILSSHEIPPVRALQGEILQNVVLTLHRPDGTVLHLSNNASPIWGNGQLIGAVVAFRDITELIQQQEQLLKARQEADEANKYKSEFLSNMSHEIRTPLNGVKGMIELADRKSSQPEVTEYLGLARQSCDHLMYIINDVLELSKIEAGHMTLHPRPFSLQETLKATFPPLHNLAADKGLDFKIEVGGDVPDALVGDPNRIRQVVENIVGNAVKFTHQGKVSVTIKRDPSYKSKDRVRLVFTVSDTGIGIPAEQQDKIFHSFGQIDPAIHIKYGGSGLGLTICRHIVRMMDGEIWFQSTEGQGSTFSFTFVLGLDQNGKEKVATRPRTPEKPWTLRILVAEDSQMNQIFTRELLTDKGHQVVVVEDGQKALDELARQRFDLVLMDIRMPVMDGEQALQKIRQDPPAGVDPETPVIALTAYALKEDQDRLLEQGFNGHLAKPIDIQAFDQAIADIEKLESASGKSREMMASKLSGTKYLE